MRHYHLAAPKAAIPIVQHMQRITKTKHGPTITLLMLRMINDKATLESLFKFVNSLVESFSWLSFVNFTPEHLLMAIQAQTPGKVSPRKRRNIPTKAIRG